MISLINDFKFISNNTNDFKNYVSIQNSQKQMQVENLSFMCHKTEVQLSAKRAKVSNLHCDVFMDWKAL